MSFVKLALKFILFWEYGIQLEEFRILLILNDLKYIFHLLRIVYWYRRKQSVKSRGGTFLFPICKESGKWKVKASYFLGSGKLKLPLSTFFNIRKIKIKPQLYNIIGVYQKKLRNLAVYSIILDIQQ